MNKPRGICCPCPVLRDKTPDLPALALLVCKALRWGGNSLVQFSIPQGSGMFCLNWLAGPFFRAFCLREEAAEFLKSPA